jgi:tRNA-splicing endonuclease subunit Sen34
VHDPAAHHTPTPSQLEAWDASRRQDITNQIALLEHRKAEAEDRATATSTATATTSTPATIQQKRAEREARRRQLAEQAAAEAGADADADTEEGTGTGAIGGRSEVKRHVDAPAPVTPTTATTSTTSNAIYTISVPTTSDTLAWYDSNNNGDDNPERHTYTYETLDAARAAHVWTYPSNAEERARCEVFRDLWEKGYYMGGGSKFGGDWLVYPGACALFTLSISLHPSSHILSSNTCVYACMRAPMTGDPLRYHSHFVATVQTSPSAPLRPMEVVAHGRLGTATKKAHLLCGWDPESREVTYFSIEWAGFG